ncbi:MAG: hypothetical protein JNK15_17510 [Planctomycetes bacterium]|nr:hypothetical protein [Planctomycetota bacterium]
MLKPCTLAFLLGSTGFASAQSAAYLVDTTLDQLFQVDLSTGALTLVGSVLPGPGTCADLAWREDTRELWTLDLGGVGLGKLDLATGAWTVVWPANPTTGWQGLAWDPTTQNFFASNQSDALYRIDPLTGTFTLVGTTNTAYLITALTVDARGNLYGIDFSSGTIAQIDKNTAVTTPIVVGMNNIQGIDVSPEGVWYGVNTTTDSLYTFDLVNGGSTLVGPCTGSQFAKGFQIIDTAIVRGGSACADGNGSVRKMTWSGSSAVGNTVTYDVEAGSSPMLAVVFLGLSAESYGPLPLPFDLAPLGAPGCSLHTSSEIGLGPVVAGIGGGVPFAIPAAPGIAGFQFFAQGVVLDASPTPNPLGLAFTDFLRTVVTL